MAEFNKILRGSRLQPPIGFNSLPPATSMTAESASEVWATERVLSTGFQKYLILCERSLKI
jgi:hypothetical protein